MNKQATIRKDVDRHSDSIWSGPRLVAVVIAGFRQCCCIRMRVDHSDSTRY